ncbi:maltokinase N-terminal cap-like domain-containing protein [Runella zeae]|uniref:maltokinase N-terminal cap-like domain-containing protein n=1 Tax=Runella zeae TaxID=94255 RepID=UPI00041B6D9B|nr:trehalose synthase [Runella zeae]
MSLTMMNFLNVSQISHLENTVFPAYFNTCRWFAGKARAQDGFHIRQQLPLGNALILIVETTYHDGPSEFYQLPLSQVSVAIEIPEKGVLEKSEETQFIDAIYDAQFRHHIFSNIYRNHTLPSSEEANSLFFERGKGLSDADSHEVESRVLPVDSSNSAMLFDGKYFMKLYRKLFDQTNPEVEMVSFLTQHSDFKHIPAYAGSVTWKRHGLPDITLGMMQQAINTNKDNWALTGDFLNDFMYGVPQGLFGIKEEVFDEVVLLGKRTGEMHKGLFAPEASADFAPEPFDEFYRHFLVNRLIDLLDRRYALLIENYQKLDESTQQLAWIFMEARELIDEFAHEMLTRPLESLRIRIHGDYHLGQVLTQDGDFILIDFEGEPEASIADRKIKHSPLKDVAGMIRSYHYAVSAKLFESRETQGISSEKLQIVSDRWYKLMRDTYIESYLETFGWPHPLFKSQIEINFLLLFFLLEKAVYELGYEISYRPSWVKIPMRGIVEVIREIEKLKESSVRISRLGAARKF